MKTHYTRLTLAEREEISKGIYAGEKDSCIAQKLGRHPSTVLREVGLQVKRRRWNYLAIRGESMAKENSRKGGRKKKLEENLKLLGYIQSKLKKEWSPEEISKRLQLEYPHDLAMRISHESIYQYLKVWI